MNRIIEHKQIIHIASEIAVISSLSYFFYQKNKKLSQEIEALTIMIQEQQQTLEKHESLIKKILESQRQNVVQKPTQYKSMQDTKPKQQDKPKQQKIVEVEVETPRVVRLDEPEEKNDSDLDDEIQSELNELE